MFENIVLTLLMILGPAALAVLTWAGLKLKNYLAAKGMNEYLKGVLQRLDDAVVDAVKGVYQAYVEPLKAEGGLSDENKAKAKAKAIEYLKSFIGEKGLKELAKVLGAEGDELDKALGNKVEAALPSVKADPSNTVK